MVPMRASTRHLSRFFLQRSQARVRGLASAMFFSLLLVGLLAGCGSSGSSSGGTTGPTAQATAAPAIQSIPPTAAVVGKTLTYDVDAIDADSTALIYSLAIAPAGMNIVPATGVITWTPQATQVGDSTVSITVSDSLNSRTQTFILSVFGVTQELASVPISSATGGTVTVSAPTSSLNGLTLTFPPNSLPGDTTIKVLELTSSNLAGGQPGVLRGMSLEPNGLVLNSPVTVTIPFDPAALSAGGGIVLPDFLGVFFLDPNTGRKVFQDTFRVDTVQNLLVGTLDHFSEYFSLGEGKICPPPTAAESDCPTTYSDVVPSSKYLPALLVHGHVAFGLDKDSVRGIGNKSTWGELQTLLGTPPSPVIPFAPDPQDRIGAWRLDYDSRDLSFRVTARFLAAAIAHIKRVTNQPAVNVVAHSFGGILTRTYLQGMASADGTGNPAGPFLAYQSNVNRLMTLGTPHQGIGGGFSRLEADGCAIESGGQGFQLPTCFEAATGIQNKGDLLRDLNLMPLPPLKSLENPQYQVIIGQRFDLDLFSADDLMEDDGLIRTAGADICAAPLFKNGICNTNQILVRKIANSASDPHALCHTNSPGVDGCGRGKNKPMVEVNDTTHPSWPIIREFLTTGSPANTPPSPVTFSTLTVSTPSHGTVISDPAGIQCGTTCVATFESGTSMTLSPLPDSGFTFSGWSGTCVNKVGPCKLAINSNTAVQATFAPQLSPPPPCPSTSLPSLPGTWTATGCMATARYWHAATVLPNGKVLVVGGSTSTNGAVASVLASAELYDPAANGGAGAWSTAGSLATARLFHTTTFLPNGKVLVVGGYTDTSTGSAIASAELYDPAANGGAGAWSATADLATARLSHTATLLPSGKVLVVGGSTSTNGAVASVLASAELWDPVANGGAGAWSTTGSLATARSGHTATLLPTGKVLVVGGNNSLASAELYDPSANGGAGAWSTTGSLATARSGHTATLLLSGKVLVVGGGGNSSILTSAELYDPAANGGAGAWSQTGSLATARFGHTATLLLSGKVLVVAGGPNNLLSIGSALASAELYDPAASGGAGAWSTTGSLAAARIFHTATLLQNGKVLVVGGSTDGIGGFLTSAEIFQ